MLALILINSLLVYLFIIGFSCSGKCEHRDRIGRHDECFSFSVVGIDIFQQVEESRLLLHDPDRLGAVHFRARNVGHFESIDSSAFIRGGDAVASCCAVHPGMVLESDPELGVLDRGLSLDAPEGPSCIGNPRPVFLSLLDEVRMWC